MYAIVEIAGKQFRVSKNTNLKVPRISADTGSKVEFDKVLFFEDDNGKNQIGSPIIDNMKISATVVEHGRDKKVIVFKKKRRKGYQKKNGHKQGFSLIKIDDIGTVKKAAKAEVKSAPKAEAPKEVTAAKPAAEKKAAPKKATATTKKAAPAKKEPAKKAAPKKAASTPKKKTESAAKKEVKPKSSEEKEA
jgi:large subunit ribosomal protein L21